MAGPIRISILANASQARKEINSVAGETSKFGAVAKKAAAVGAVAAGAAVTAAVAVTKSASSAQQSLGATQTVFGKYADTVIKRSDQAAKSIGLSANEYRELSNVVGASLQGAGVPLKKTTQLTADLNKRAADMAATFGGTTKEAVEAVSSLLRGEADPIERYGVSIKQTDVNARLAAKGQDQLTGAAKKSAEMQARLDLMFQKTSKTQGAFQRESGTLAHQQQVLGAQFENLKAKLGTALLPVLTAVLTAINNNFLPAIKKIGEFLGPVIAKVKEWFNSFSGGAGGGALQTFVGFIQTQVIPAVMGIVNAFKGYLAVIIPIYQQVFNALKANWGKIAPYVQQVWNSVKTIITGVLKIIAQIIRVITGVVTAIWKRFGSTILAFVTASFRNIAQFIGGIMKAIAGVVKTVLAVLKGDWAGAWNGIKQIASGVWQAIKALVKQGVTIVKAVVSAAWNALKAITTAAWNGIKSAVTNAVNGFMNVVRNVPSMIKGAFSGAASWLYSAGQDIIQGLLNGLESAKDWVAGKISEIANMVPDKLKGILGIASPSKVTKKIGHWIMEGLRLGLADGSKRVEKVIDRAAAIIKSRLKDKAEKRALRSIQNETAALRRNASARDRVARSQKKANEALTEAKKLSADYASGIKQGVVNYGAITSLDAAFNSDAIIARMRKNLDKAKQYQALLAKLASQGLNKTTLDQLAQAGVEGGLATADALARGGVAAVKEVNSLTTQLASTGQQMGNTVAKEMYGAGIQAAQGLINGLNRKARELDRAAKRLAQSLVAAVKRALGIKSPSRVFKELGEMTVKGMQIGLDDTHVKRSGERLSKALTDSFGRPKLEAALAGTKAGGPTQITLHLTADQITQIERGRRIQVDLDAYLAAGGRRRA